MPSPGLIFALGLLVNFFFSFYMYLKQEFLIPKRNILGRKVGRYNLTQEEAKAIAKKQMLGFALMFVALVIANLPYQSYLCLAATLIFLFGVYYMLLGNWLAYRMDKMRSE
ncbi:MAG: hypothetical protein H6670_11315 [Anaerolineaceae bacterium]|nr:hypothetical protein [Anaerolineaceae bacterium]